MNFEDYLAIKNLMGRYGHIMDECSMIGGEWERLGEIFTEDAIFDLSPMGGERIVGLDRLIAVWNDAVHPFGHHATNLVIEASADGGATCDSKMIAILPDGRCNSGYYKDRLVRTAKGWRISYRAAKVRNFDLSARLPAYVNETSA